jgi:hypothetical protein
LAREEAGNVLNKEPRWSELVSDPSKLEEESGSLSRESCSFAGDGEVLAREASDDEIWMTPALPVTIPVFCPRVATVSLACPL